MREGRAAQVAAAMKPNRHKRKAVRDCCTYFENNLDRMRCDDCRRRGWQIGSGAVEGANGQAVCMCMKKPVSRQSEREANFPMATGCRALTNRTADYLGWQA